MYLVVAWEDWSTVVVENNQQCAILRKSIFICGGAAGLSVRRHESLSCVLEHRRPTECGNDGGVQSQDVQVVYARPITQHVKGIIERRTKQYSNNFY